MMFFGNRTAATDDSSGAAGGAPGDIRKPRRPKIGLALGAGVARGWSHIGILRELEANNFRPDVIAGTSVGAVVGGCYAAGALDDLESFARGLSRRKVLSLMDLSFTGAGLIGGNKLKKHLDAAVGAKRIEELPRKFAAVATEMGTGHEIWLTRGPLVESIRASYALPGLFEPVRIGGRWLFDGAMSNPVPVTVCRSLGADFVIAVDLVSDSDRRSTVIHDGRVFDESIEVLEKNLELEQQADPGKGFFAGIRRRARLRRTFREQENGAPGIATAMIDAFSIIQDRISRSRLAGDPPDLQIAARVGKIGLFDFHRADDLISLGRDAARKVLPDLRERLVAQSGLVQAL